MFALSDGNGWIAAYVAGTAVLTLICVVIGARGLATRWLPRNRCNPDVN